jgi:hypothetical protein
MIRDVIAYQLNRRQELGPLPVLRLSTGGNSQMLLTGQCAH